MMRSGCIMRSSVAGMFDPGSGGRGSLKGESRPRSAVWSVRLNLVSQVGSRRSLQASPPGRGVSATARGLLTTRRFRFPIKECWLKAFRAITHLAGARYRGDSIPDYS